MIAETIREKKWYTIKVQNNREKSVSERLKSDMLKFYETEINFLIPTQAIASVKNGKKVVKEQILYPGYVFVETDSIGQVEYLVKSTNGATNVLKDTKGKPQQIKQSDIDKMITEKEKAKEVVESSYVIGQKIEIVSGAFNQFKGNIEKIDEEKNKVTVQVAIFGRPTSVELTLTEIIKVVD